MVDFPMSRRQRYESECAGIRKHGVLKSIFWGGLSFSLGCFAYLEYASRGFTGPFLLETSGVAITAGMTKRCVHESLHPEYYIRR